MPDLRGLLDRRAEAFLPALDGLERVRLRADRRRRNRRITAGVVAVAVFAGSAAGLWAAFGGGARQHPVASGALVTTPLPEEPSDIAAGEGAVWVAMPHEVLRLDPASGEIVTSIPVSGTGQLAVGFGSVWVTNFRQDSVTRIDAATNAVQTTIPVGPLPFDVAPGDRAFLPFDIAAGEGAVWVDTARGEVVRINPATNAIANVVRLDPDGPGAIAAGEGSVWVADTLEPGAVWRIDPRTGEISQTIGVGSQPVSIEAGAGAAWVAVGFDRDHRRLVRIDAGTGVSMTVARGVGLGPIAVTPETLWVADGAGNVTQVDPQTEQTTDLGRVTGKHISLLVATDDALWATDLDDQTVTRVDRACLEGGCSVAVRPGRVTTSELPTKPFDVAVGEGSVWVAAQGGVERVDPATGRVQGSAEFDPEQVAVASGSVWVAEPKVRLIDRIDPSTNQEIAELNARDLACYVVPADIAADVSEVWIAGPGCHTGWAARINTATNEFDTDRLVDIGGDPTRIAVYGTDVWVIRRDGGGRLVHIDGTRGSVVGELFQGESPQDAVSGEDAIWVAVGNDVARVDASTGEVLSRTRVGESQPSVMESPGAAYRLAVGEGAVWVKVLRGDTRPPALVQLDPVTGNVVGEPMEISEYSVALAAGEGAVWIANYYDRRLTRVELLCGEAPCAS
jgi:YVTN family beta-propeller protein